jgi:molybdopterin synthase catalytic subunit
MTVHDTERFSRQLLVWGEENQRRLAQSTLLIAGLGGLGATVSQILARAGVAALHLVDDGTVALSDLHRQSLYGECDVGRKKVEVAKERLIAINSGVNIIARDTRIDRNYRIPAEVHVVVDCLDNFVSRFDLYAATSNGQFFVHGGVEAYQGQVLTLIKGTSQPLDEILAGCQQPNGPIPITADSVIIIAGLICNELFRINAGTPNLLNRFLVVDLSHFTFSYLEV